MGEDKRHRLRPMSLNMVKVDIVIAHACKKLWIPVQVSFRFAPVVLFRPKISERIHVVPIGPVPPIVPVEPVRELCFPHAIEYPVNCGLRNGYLEWPRILLNGCIKHDRTHRFLIDDGQRKSICLPTPSAPTNRNSASQRASALSVLAALGVCINST